MRSRRKQGAALVALGLAVTLLAGLVLGWASLPDLDRLEDYRPPLSTVVVDRRGRTIGEFFWERRHLVSIDEVPRHVVQAFLASEDAAFFSHGGVDLAAVGRAAWANLRARRVVQGGSTITQQLAKNIFLSSRRTLGRKLQEMLLALRIEQRFSKPEILELYLNQIYFGAGAHGLAQAAATYFGKEASALTLSEAALLASLPKAPSSLSPLLRREAADQRRVWVLDRMLALGHVDEAAWRAAVGKRPVLAAPGPSQAHQDAAYFVEEVRQSLFTSLGSEPVLRGGLRIETTLDLDLQSEAARAVRTGLDALVLHRGAGEARPEGALLAIDVESGDVLAMVGGYDFAQSAFNRAVQARRQPGSAFKTFVYGAAVEAGFRANELVYDYQVDYADPARGGRWRPRNASDRLLGPIGLSEAFARSLNNATIRLLGDVGVERVHAFARRAGIRSPLTSDLGLALGTSEVTLLEITRAYGTFASGGRPLRPRLVRRVLDRDGHDLLGDSLALGDTPAGASEGISAVDASLVTHLLREVVRAWYGTGHGAARIDRPLAGKTGSTNGNRDAWFVGFSPEIVAGVWVGHDDMASLGPRETGGRAALPIWTDFMEFALSSRPPREFPRPEGVVFSHVDPETGEASESPVAFPGWTPLAAGRKLRRSTYVAPPAEPEPAVAEAHDALVLPAVAAPPP